MRVTDLNFRNPKEFTPDAGHPKITNTGRGFLTTSGPKFGMARRFSQTLPESQRDQSKIGPGSYNLNRYSFLKPSITKTPKFKLSYVGIDLGNTGYTMVGNQIVYDPKYSVMKGSVGSLRSSLSPLDSKAKKSDCSKHHRWRSTTKTRPLKRRRVQRKQSLS